MTQGGYHSELVSCDLRSTRVTTPGHSSPFGSPIPWIWKVMTVASTGQPCTKHMLKWRFLHLPAEGLGFL